MGSDSRNPEGESEYDSGARTLGPGRFQSALRYTVCSTHQSHVSCFRHEQQATSCRSRRCDLGPALIEPCLISRHPRPARQDTAEADEGLGLGAWVLFGTRHR